MKGIECLELMHCLHAEQCHINILLNVHIYTLRSIINFLIILKYVLCEVQWTSTQCSWRLHDSIFLNNSCYLIAWLILDIFNDKFQISWMVGWSVAWKKWLWSIWSSGLQTCHTFGTLITKTEFMQAPC